MKTVISLLLAALVVQAAPSFPNQPAISDQARAVHDHVLKAVKDPLGHSGIPSSSILASGKVVSDVLAYGDTADHCDQMFYPNFIQTKEELLITSFLFDKSAPSGGPCAVKALKKLNELNQGKPKIRVYFLVSSMSEISFAIRGGFKIPRLSDLFWGLSETYPSQFNLPPVDELLNLDFRIKTYHYKPFGTLHNKIFVRDGNTLIMGSKNWDALPGMEYTIKMEGAVAASARQDFLRIWNEPIKDVSTLATTPKAGDVPILYLSRTSNSWPTHPEENAQDQGWIKAMEVAKKSVFIMSPNFITQMIADKALEAVKRGVKVTVITSFSFHDVASYFNTKSMGNNKATIRKMYTDLLSNKAATANLEMCYFMGKRVQPPKPVATEFAHVKFMAVDDQFVIVGSGNQDTQSWYNSSESNVLIDDPTETKRIVKKLTDAQQSTQFCYRDWYGQKLATDPTWMDDGSSTDIPEPADPW